MSKWWSHFLDLVSNQLVVEEERGQAQREPDILESVETARKDWLTARTFFDNATDPDLIDHAIYWIGAAEKKYVYLLKQAKMQGVSLPKDQTEHHILSERYLE